MVVELITQRSELDFWGRIYLPPITARRTPKGSRAIRKARVNCVRFCQLWCARAWVASALQATWGRSLFLVRPL